jgi:tetratricopeptide (TPR) repeat protein
MHLRLAGPLADQAAVAEHSLRASEAAAAVYAWDEAVAHMRAAFEALERAGGPPAERARLAERLGVLVYKAGTNLEDGIGYLERALAAYQSVGDKPAAARTRSRLGMHLTTYPATLDVAAGLAHYEAAEAELARQPRQRRLGYLYVGMAMAAVFGVRTGRLEIASRQALELAAELGDEPLVGWASYQRAWWAFNHGRLAESLSLHERMREIAARFDDVGMSAWAAFGRALLSGTYLADPLTARTWCSRALARQRLQALRRQHDSLLDQLGQAKGSSGELTEARQIAAGLGPGTVLGRMLLYWSGDWEQSEAAWAAARDRDACSGDRLDGILNTYWLGRVRRLLGAHEAAGAALQEGLAVAQQGPQVPAEVMLRAELALLAAGTGRLEAGRAQLARCHEIIRAGEDWRGLAGRVTLAAAMLAAAEGTPRKADEAFASAVNTFHTYASRWDEAEARCLWAKAAPAEASRQHKRATALYHRIGASRRWTAWAAEPID